MQCLWENGAFLFVSLLTPYLWHKTKAQQILHMNHPVAASFENGLVEHAQQSVFPIDMVWQPQSLAAITSFCILNGK